MLWMLISYFIVTINNDNTTSLIVCLLLSTFASYLLITMKMPVYYGSNECRDASIFISIN